MAINGSLGRKLRCALIGGGPGSFIGKVHSIAAQLDGQAEIVAGVFSRDHAKSLACAPDYGVANDRVYADVNQLAQLEGKALDFAIIATPNDSHFDCAAALLAAGVNVVCDKPMTFDVDQAKQLVKLVEQIGAVFALTHNYTGYPLVRQAREMILNGELGEINAVRAHYIQGWLRTRLELENQTQASWRTDPKRSGAAGCFGDIGSHAYNLGRYMTGLKPLSVSATLRTFEKGRALDDYGTAQVNYAGGAVGLVIASQISHGRENDLRIEIDGTKASIEFRQENPNELILRKNGEPMRVYTRGGAGLGTAANNACRLPPGHPEGYFEGFANVYRAAYVDMSKRATGEVFDGQNTVYPNVYDGLDGMKFINGCVESSRADGAPIALSLSA